MSINQKVTLISSACKRVHCYEFRSIHIYIYLFMLLFYFSVTSSSNIMRLYDSFLYYVWVNFSFSIVFSSSLLCRLFFIYRCKRYIDSEIPFDSHQFVYLFCLAVDETHDKQLFHCSPKVNSLFASTNKIKRNQQKKNNKKTLFLFGVQGFFLLCISYCV